MLEILLAKFFCNFVAKHLTTNFFYFYNLSVYTIILLNIAQNLHLVRKVGIFMKQKLQCMFLGSKSGVRDDGGMYYQGQFLEKSSNSVFRLYFPDDSKLKTYIPYKDYEIDVELYLNNKGLWALRTI